MSRQPILHESSEDYLECIYILENQKGSCRSIDVANFLGITKASVSRAMKKLQEEDCIIIGDHGKIILTEKGMKIAKGTYQKHMFFKDMLIDAGVEEEVAEYEACRMEHIISDDTFEKLKKANEQ